MSINTQLTNNAFYGSGLYPNGSAVRMDPQNDQPRKYEVDSKILGNTGLKPVELAVKYIESSLEYDQSTPVLESSTHLSSPVNYFYNRNINGLGAFNCFEKIVNTSIPEKVIEEITDSSKSIDMGLFQELNKAWIVNGSKLILWDYLKSEDYSVIDEIPHDILAIKLIKPKKETFVESVQHLLLVSTQYNVYILALSVASDGKLEIYNTDLSVSTGSLNVDTFVWSEKTGQIFFSGPGDGLNIWELRYSSEEKWFDRKCNKRCLTRSNLSYLVPTSSIFGSTQNSGEHIVSMTIDESRDILYTLSTKSAIRAYSIKKDSLENPFVLTPSKILIDLRTTDCKGAKLLTGPLFKIVSINIVSKFENENLYLVAITQGGCRIYLNGALYSGRVAALRFQNIKFPPPKLTFSEIEQQEKQNQGIIQNTNMSLLSYQKESPILVNTTKKSKIFSPGVFVAAIEKTKRDQDNNRLFVSVPDYGVLNYYHKYMENATFLENSGIIFDIVQLTPSVHATNTPKGYANFFATQYTARPLNFAVLTNKGISVFQQRTPTSIFLSLGEQLFPFVARYGLQEACSTALNVICNDKYSEYLKLNAFNFFVGSLSNVENKPVYESPTLYLDSGVSSSFGSTVANTTQYSFANVKLSPRFYGIVLLISRIFREIWTKNVFSVNKSSLLANGTKNEKYLKETNCYLSSINIEKTQVIGFLNTAVVLLKFFDDYGNRIPFFANSLANRGISKEEETAALAENTALRAIYELLSILKEAFSFLLILFDESIIIGFEDQKVTFKDTIKFISLDTQYKLANLKFQDLFSLNNDTKSIVKDVFTSIINKNISKGLSVDYLADALQRRCSSFCSANDVIIFRAFEHIRKADSIGSKDNDSKLQQLEIAVKLFKKVGESLSLADLKSAVTTMVKLDYYPEVIEFVLDMSNIIDKNKVAVSYVNDGKPLNDERESLFRAKIERYRLVFEILVEIDIKSIQNYEEQKNNNKFKIAESRNQSYAICFKYNDILFHYELYNWFVKQEIEDKLLEIDTPFILPYLKEKSVNSAKISYLLSKYYSKRHHFFEAASVFFELAKSDFNLELEERIELLAKARGFCNCVEQFNLRQQTVELLNNIQNNLDVSAIQLKIIEKLQNDQNISDEVKLENVAALNNKILDVSSLYNEFADPLNYHDICLLIFKESDYRNFDEISNKWDALLSEASARSKSNESEPLSILVSNMVIQIGQKVNVNESVFPIPVLIDKLLKIIKPYDVVGTIADIFIKSGVSYSKMYYILKEMIETNSKDSKIGDELVYLIKDWWSHDSRLKEVISSSEISNFRTYSATNDPVNKYIGELGI